MAQDNIDKIIEQVMAALRGKGPRAFSSEKVYSDEPILRRGSQMASYLPERIRAMRELARSREARTWSDARLFVEQGRLMADYEDDYPYHGTFQAYYPTYHYMTDQQLRGYFTWRARVRRGLIEETSASFAYVYLYELINGIGVTPGKQGFAAIECFWRTYRTFEPSMDRYVRTWLVDYAAYHDLDPALVAPYAGAEHDQAVALLARTEKEALEAVPPGRRAKRNRDYGRDPDADAALLHALSAVSTYRLEESRFAKDDPEAVRCVTHAVFDRLARHYRSSRSQGLVESFFGTSWQTSHVMFGTAVFWEGKRHPNCTYDATETCVYECEDGRWTVSSLHDGGERSAKLGQVLRAVDRRLRVALDYPHPLKDHSDPKYLVKIIDTEIDGYLAWKHEEEARREAERLEREAERLEREAHEVRIDLSKLDGIRAAAAKTRESLLVDEEREESPDVEETPANAPKPIAQAPQTVCEGPSSVAATSDATPKAQPPRQASDALGLTDDELAFLEDLLAGRTPGRETSADLLADSVNEKLFDLLGDIALEFSDDGRPRVIEDYAEDVREALGL